MDDLLQEVLNASLVVVSLFLLGRFGLGPGSDIPRASPSRGEEEFSFLGTKWDVGFGLVPHFALGPIANVPDPTSSGGDFLMLGMSDVDGWLDVRGSKLRNVGVSTPSCRTWEGVFRNNINSVTGLDPVRAPSSFLALARVADAVLRTTRGG
jgi:hypothetical protein